MQRTVNPETLGGVPVTTQTNNWWDGAGAAVGEALDGAQRLASQYVQFRQSTDLVRARGVPYANPPPGQYGMNAQAATVPGAWAVDSSGNIAGMSPVVLVGLALVAVVVLRKVLR